MGIFAKTALLDQEWQQNLRLTIRDGLIESLTPATTPGPDDIRVDILLPALSNLHSHSFQRAMAGLTEFRAAGRESFWTWRDVMYRFLAHLRPEQYEAIAALTFMEMQEAGYAAVGEFHYVHHQADGTPYAALTELSDQVFAAAQRTGIGLTHLPVLYSYGGVGRAPLDDGQRRFANDVDRFLRLVEGCRSRLADMPADTGLGIAPHSLRATSPEDLERVTKAVPQAPVHIHIAEQRREVREVEAMMGQTPVAWLLDHLDVDERWCLIHATHMTDAETMALARSNAVAGLCPVTEANLGDGAFNGAKYVQSRGRFGLGSDSNIRISLTEELRGLEYSQRLRDEIRNVMVAETGSVGHALYTMAAAGGAQALARASGRIAVGQLADLTALDRGHPVFFAARDDQLLDALCFAAPDSVVTDTWCAGRHMVRAGRHVERDAIVEAYRGAVKELIEQF